MLNADELGVIQNIVKALDLLQVKHGAHLVAVATFRIHDLDGNARDVKIWHGPGPDDAWHHLLAED